MLVLGNSRNNAALESSMGLQRHRLWYQLSNKSLGVNIRAFWVFSPSSETFRALTPLTWFKRKNKERRVTAKPWRWHTWPSWYPVTVPFLWPVTGRKPSGAGSPRVPPPLGTGHSSGQAVPQEFPWLQALASLALSGRSWRFCVALHRACLGGGSIQPCGILQGHSQQDCLHPVMVLEKARVLHLYCTGDSLVHDWMSQREAWALNCKLDCLSNSRLTHCAAPGHAVASCLIVEAAFDPVGLIKLRWQKSGLGEAVCPEHPAMACAAISSLRRVSNLQLSTVCCVCSLKLPVSAVSVSVEQ